MVESATEGLAGVSASQVEMQSGIQFYDGITTGEIQEILVRSASDLVDLDNPNYQFVARKTSLVWFIQTGFRYRVEEWIPSYPRTPEVWCDQRNL